MSGGQAVHDYVIDGRAVMVQKFRGVIDTVTVLSTENVMGRFTSVPRHQANYFPANRRRRRGYWALDKNMTPTSNGKLYRGPARTTADVTEIVRALIK